MSLAPSGQVRAMLAALAAASSLLAGSAVGAKTIEVPAGGDRLVQAIAAAASGDVLRLGPGVHSGPIVIDRPLTLEGEPGAAIDGGGLGRTIEVTAPDVVIGDLTIQGSGTNLERMDSGVFLERTAERAQVLGNRLQGNLIGVYVHGAHDAMVRDNHIVGRGDLRISEAGNGVSVWNAPGAAVVDNDISGGRDGIFTNYSHDNIFRGNRIHSVRFAVHYMYTNRSEVVDNVSVGNHAGYVLMYSTDILVRNNISTSDGGNGLLLNYTNSSRIEGNVILDSGGKCLFIYNANKNLIRRNWFEGCGIGVHFTAGSERNAIADNAFIANQTQVKYVGTRFIDWSENRKGNYWSDDPAFDLNGDGIADTAYRPNDIVDQIVWRYPAAKLLLNSPALQFVRWAQAQFPTLHPGGVIDSAPLMRPPVVAALGAAEALRPVPPNRRVTP